MQKMKCPRCGAMIELTPQPENPNRVQAICSCVRGPVFEANKETLRDILVDNAGKSGTVGKLSKSTVDSDSGGS